MIRTDRGRRDVGASFFASAKVRREFDFASQTNENLRRAMPTRILRLTDGGNAWTYPDSHTWTYPVLHNR